LASPFGDDPLTGDQAPQPTTPETPASAARQRFLGCRWRKAAENGVPDHCGHRDVLPMAGVTGFDPEAWCPDCQYFKAKRVPRKREEIDRDRDRDWRW
jgi:hypothetical protein